MPLLVVAGTNLLVLPATVIALGGVVLAANGLRRSSEAAAMPLGVALVAGAVVAVADIMTGDLMLAATGLAAVTLLGMAWWALDRARRAEHAAWSERFGRALERDRELSQRRDALRDRRPEDR